MNSLRTIQGALVGATLTLIGCGREKEAEAPSVPSIQGVSTGAVRTVPTVIEKPPTNALPGTNQTTAQASTEVIPKALDAAATNIQAGASAALDRVQGILDAARRQIGERKWTEALSLLEQLAGQQLTPDQETALRNLKQQVQQGARAAGATKVGEGVTRLLEESKPPK